MASTPQSGSALQGSSALQGGSTQPGGSALPPSSSQGGHTTLLDDINQECVVPICDTTFPQFCFNLEADFTLKNDKKNKPKYHRQYETVGVILSGAINTSGGIFAVISQTPVTQDVIDKWSNNLPTQLSFMPRWIYSQCLSIHFIKLNKPAVIFVIKKSAQTVTYNSHMFIRRPEGSSQVADTETALAVLARPRGANRQQPRSGGFIIPSSYTYGEQLPPESLTLEYKHWSSASTVTDLILKVRDDRTKKGLFSLANNQTESYLLIGVNDADCTVIGQGLSDADKPIFLAELSHFMFKDDDGNLRIWGEVGRIPVQGTDWDLTFVPVYNCPNGQLRVLIIVTMYPCFGGLFERCPECYILADDGKIEMLSFSEWKNKITEEAKLSTTAVSSTTAAPSTTTTSSTTTAPSTTTGSSTTTAPFAVTMASLATSTDPSTSTATKPSDSATIAPSEVPTGSSAAITAPSVPPVTSVAATDTYQSASWTDCSNWRRYIVDDHNNSGSSSEADLPYDQSSMMKMEKGINLSPSFDKLNEKYPLLRAEIEAMFMLMKHECGPVPACAITFTSWTDSFDHQASIVPPAGHILDTLMISQNYKLQMWICVETQGNTAQQKSHIIYAYELCRVLQKHMLLQQRNIKPYRAIHVQIMPVLFYADVNQSNTALHAGDPITQLYSACMSSVSGVRLEGLQSAVISLLLIRNVWVRDRVGRDKTYHLTKQQVNGLCQFCNQRISLIEAAPGCGKSVMANSVCQRFRPDEVLYISPSRGFTSFIDYQGVATAKHVQNDKDIREVNAHIQDTDYHVVVIDDIQAMDGSTDLWTDLLEAVYSRDHTRILFLMDSQYQDYHQYYTCFKLKESIRRFCEKKRVQFCSIPLSQNMRNSRKVFTFLKAQILKEPGVGLVNEDLTSGHSVDGDDVVVRYLDDPWLDATDNELIKLVQRLIDPQSERGYEAKDIVILVDNKTVYAGRRYEPDSDDGPASILRRIFEKHTSLTIHRAPDLPHEGLVIDTVDEFTGMEAVVCVVLLSQTGKKRSHTNMKYRMFVASRGIMRTELVFLRPLDRDVTSMMGLDSTATAEKYTQAAVLWEKRVGGRVLSMTFLVHHSNPVILYTVYDRSDYKLLAMTTAGDPVTDLPLAFTAVSCPRFVCVSRDQARAVVCDDVSYSSTTLVRQGGDWRKHKTYDTPSYITAVTITPDGGVALTRYGHLCKYDVSGVHQWDKNVPESIPTTLGVGSDGALYVPQYDRDAIFCHGPNGSRSGSIAISKPWSVCWTDAGLLVGHDRDDGVHVISVVSPDGRRRRQIATVGGEPLVIAAYEHLMAVGTHDGRLYLFDVSQVV